MLKKWKSLSLTAGLATILLLGATTTPSAADPNNGKSATETSAVETTVTVAPETSANTATDTNNAKASNSKKQKSVLDAEVLESPLSIFNDFSSGSDEDEDASNMTVKSSTIVLALKALAATLLSTIM